jgi:hypothetical protein
VAENLDQFGPLTVAEAGDRLLRRRSGSGRARWTLAGPIFGTGGEQLVQLRRLRARWRVSEHLRKLDRASGEFSFQLCLGEKPFVDLLERGQPLLGERPGAVGLRLSIRTAPILRGQAEIRPNPKTRSIS